MDKDTLITEHKENVRRNRTKTSGFWKITTFIFLILFIGAIYFNGMPSMALSNDASVDEAVNFINENMLMGLAPAEVTDVSEEYGLYKVDLLITSASLDVSEEYSSYMTKDGKLLFPTVVDLTEFGTEETIEETTEEEEETTEEVEIDYTTDAILGSEDAPVSIIVYSDFECPYCQNGYYTLEEVIAEYGESVKVIFKNFPLSFHQYAQKAAEAGECANDQGMFWELHNLMFENNDALTVDDLKQYAADLGMNTETFNACLDSGEKASEIEKDMADGATAGITGTPTFFINDEMLVGAQPFDSFAEIIDGILAESEPAEETETEEQPSEEVVEETTEEETTDECGGCEEGYICFDAECIAVN